MITSSRSIIWLFLAAAICFFLPASARGEVNGSPHDLYSQGFLVIPEDKALSDLQCQTCHISEPEDERPLLWKTVPYSLERYGKEGILCYSCHDGISIVNRDVDSGLTVYHPDGTCYDANKLPEGTDVTNTGLPYLVDNMIRCTTCHDPHSQTFRPFLRVPLVGICSRCHTDRRHLGFGGENLTGNHPVSIEPFDSEGRPSPIEVQYDFRVPFPEPYPKESGRLSEGTHWNLGGHLSLGSEGRIECITCHARHGREDVGPLENMLAKDPVRKVADEFCEGCHRGERGDGEEEPPYPNPGGTTTGRTYHPADNDVANGESLILAMPEIEELRMYGWGEEDPVTEYPRILCTTCHVAHDGMADSPALVKVADSLFEELDVTTFCEICHWQPPENHHGYGFTEDIVPGTSTINIPLNIGEMGAIYGSPEPGTVYCAHCHRAHNAGYGDNESEYIPILNDNGMESCSLCHGLGVSHFMGDPKLPSTYGKEDPPLKRDVWTYSGERSFYAGTGNDPTTVTCLSCHRRSNLTGEEEIYPGYLLAPAGESVEWEPGYPDEYLCTGCHGEAPATIGGGNTHPLLEADTSKFSAIYTNHLVAGETPVSYTEYGGINCHSCHRAHGAVLEGGVYILKAVRGGNVDPKAIRPRIDFTPLCHSCHPASQY